MGREVMPLVPIGGSVSKPRQVDWVERIGWGVTVLAFAALLASMGWFLSLGDEFQRYAQHMNW